MSFELKKNPTKWAIVATGQSWELLNPNTDSMIFCLNDLIKTEKYGIRPDYLAIMDVLDEKPQVVAGQDNLGSVIKRINDLRVPLIAPYKYAEIPLSEAFPLDACVKEFGMPYFTNTICYMIAYSLLKGAKEIEIYGVNQASSSEYANERGGVEYWLGIAVGRGVKVTVNGANSQLLGNNPRAGGMVLYGYNQSYQSFKEIEKKFGPGIIKQLTGPPPKVSRTVREINPK